MWSIFVFSSLSNTFRSHPKELHLAEYRSTSKDHYVSFKYLSKNPLPRHVNASRRISQTRHLYHCPLPRVGASGDGNAELLSDSEQPSVDRNEPTRSSAESATLGLKLPRRSLLVQFTCNACGERTGRYVNRVAYERGTIFLQVDDYTLWASNHIDVEKFAYINDSYCLRSPSVTQCAGCQQYHKFVDNLGLVVEYDFRKEEDADTED